MSDQSKKPRADGPHADGPRADEHTEGRPLDLSPLLYPELSSEAEREALLKALERDEEARAQLAQLELARRLIEERAAHRAERLGAEVSLSQAQRANVLEVARAQARRARAQRGAARGPLAHSRHRRLAALPTARVGGRADLNDGGRVALSNRARGAPLA